MKAALVLLLCMANCVLFAQTDYDRIDDALQKAGFPSSCRRIDFAAKFLKPPYIHEDVWERVKPFLLPEDHPIRAKLDEIFSKRVTLNRKSLKKAGFKNTKPGKYSGTTVTTHDDLKGYIIKLFTDDQSCDDAALLRGRVRGAMEAQKVIDKYGFHSYFVVPKKWLYPLPENPAPSSKYSRRHFILIAEEIDILAKKANNSRWKSPKVSPEMLNALFTVLKEAGLYDAVYPFNLPFTKDKKIAFVDTEMYHMWPVPMRKLRRYLSSERKEYWMKLIENEGSDHSLAY